jgi:hypothetical protein
MLLRAGGGCRRASGATASRPCAEIRRQFKFTAPIRERITREDDVVGKLLAVFILAAVPTFTCAVSHGQEAAVGRGESSTTPAPQIASPVEHVRHLRAHKKHKPEPDLAETRKVQNSAGKSPESAVRQSKSTPHEGPQVAARRAISTKQLSQAQKNKRKVVAEHETSSRPKSPAATREPKSRGFFEELFDNN